jgi:hypothetical protein
MWDYNIGLVRITPFFKCCKYSKVRAGSIMSSAMADFSIDYASQNVELKSRLKGNHPQHYWRSISSTRSVDTSIKSLRMVC